MVAAALYAPAPDAGMSALEAGLWGDEVHAASNQPISVWPDNWTSVHTFANMATQWRTGPNGVLGLDYTALPVVLRLNSVPRAAHKDVFADVRHMESTALSSLRSATQG